MYGDQKWVSIAIQNKTWSLDANKKIWLLTIEFGKGACYIFLKVWSFTLGDWKQLEI
jgi:hypothetical protein